LLLAAVKLDGCQPWLIAAGGTGLEARRTV